MKVTFQNFRITATFKGDKKADWSDMDNWNNHTVTVYNTETKKRISFDFWASIAMPRIKTTIDALEAFQCFIWDALAGELDRDFEEFCSDMGYDTDSRRAEQTWKACQEAYRKLDKVSDIDICDLADELQEHLESLY